MKRLRQLVYSELPQNSPSRLKLESRLSELTGTRSKNNFSGPVWARRKLGWAGHGGEKLRVCLGLGEAAQQKFHGFHRRERTQNLAQHPDAIQLIRREEQFVFTCAGAIDIDGGEHALVDQAAVEIDFHVAGTFELFEDDVVHAAAGIDQRGSDDGERATLFDVSRGSEKAARALQSISVDTTGKNFTGRRRNGVVSAAETGERVEQNHNVALVFHQPLGFFEDHLRDLNVALGRLVEGGADDFALHCALHIGNFFWALVDEKNNQRDVGMIGGDGIGDGLQHHGFTGSRGSDNQSALAFADGAKHVEHATRKIFLGGLQADTFLGIERC